jgi:hypothetical protein
MSMPVRNDLTPEEHAIAERLSRLDLHAAPSPAIDARILAAARTATGPRPRHAPRWPLAFGLAASLLLVAGLAWRMLPQPGPDADRIRAMQPRSAPVASNAPVTTGAPAAKPSNDQVPTDVTDRVAADQVSPRKASPAAEPAPQPGTVEAPVGLDAPMPAMPAPAAPPPPPPVAAEPTPAQAEAKAAAVPAPISRVAGRQADEAAQASESTSSAGSEAAPSESDEPLDAMPPATADAPEVRDAWLLRIRALFDRGDIAGGRASLRAFAQRYPDYPLPEDLRALLR